MCLLEHLLGQGSLCCSCSWACLLFRRSKTHEVVGADSLAIVAANWVSQSTNYSLTSRLLISLSLAISKIWISTHCYILIISC
uniref:Uncharacterized protein n=1 Tax=Arundo donax TaxID=35708 RepID=A0A0A9HG22_ARUDO